MPFMVASHIVVAQRGVFSQQQLLHNIFKPLLLSSRSHMKCIYIHMISSNPLSTIVHFDDLAKPITLQYLDRIVVEVGGNKLDEHLIKIRLGL